MTEMLFSPQIPLQLEPSREQRFENFVEGPNASAVRALNAMAAGSGEQQAHLSGSAGSGKTHLLNALCLAEREAGGNAFYAGLGAVPQDATGMLDGLDHVRLLCLDDVDAVLGDPEWEEALFHCFNRCRDAGQRLVFTSTTPLAGLPVGLPDLASRLRWGLRLVLQPLGDGDKLRVLDRHARSLGVELPPDVGRYLLRRSSRHMGTLVTVLERLQQAAFRSKRRITIPLARELLGTDDGRTALRDEGA